MLDAAARRKAIEFATRFKWGFDNACGGSDDWRCGVNLRAELCLDDNDDEMAYDDGPCDCPECEGATARMWSKDGKLPLSVRVALNLASPQPEKG